MARKTTRTQGTPKSTIRTSAARTQKSTTHTADNSVEAFEATLSQTNSSFNDSLAARTQVITQEAASQTKRQVQLTKKLKTLTARKAATSTRLRAAKSKTTAAAKVQAGKLRTALQDLTQEITATRNELNPVKAILTTIKSEQKRTAQLTKLVEKFNRTWDKQALKKTKAKTRTRRRSTTSTTA